MHARALDILWKRIVVGRMRKRTRAHLQQQFNATPLQTGPIVEKRKLVHPRMLNYSRWIESWWREMCLDNSTPKMPTHSLSLCVSFSSRINTVILRYRNSCFALLRLRFWCSGDSRDKNASQDNNLLFSMFSCDAHKLWFSCVLLRSFHAASCALLHKYVYHCHCARFEHTVFITWSVRMCDTAESDWLEPKMTFSFNKW